MLCQCIAMNQVNCPTKQELQTWFLSVCLESSSALFEKDKKKKISNISDEKSVQQRWFRFETSQNKIIYKYTRFNTKRPKSTRCNRKASRCFLLFVCSNNGLVSVMWMIQCFIKWFSLHFFPSHSMDIYIW